MTAVRSRRDTCPRPAPVHEPLRLAGLQFASIVQGKGRQDDFAFNNFSNTNPAPFSFGIAFQDTHDQFHAIHRTEHA